MMSFTSPVCLRILWFAEEYISWSLRLKMFQWKNPTKKSLGGGTININVMLCEIASLSYVMASHFALHYNFSIN